MSFSSPRVHLARCEKIVFTKVGEDDTMAQSYLKEFTEVRNFIWERKDQLIHDLKKTDLHSPLQMVTSVVGIFNNAILSFQFLDTLLRVTGIVHNKSKSRKGAKIDAVDFTKWSSIFTTAQLGFLEHTYVAGFHNPFLSDCASLLGKIGPRGVHDGELSAHCLYNWFRARHQLFLALDSIEKLETMTDTLRPCIFENGDIPVTFSTPVLKRPYSLEASDASEETDGTKRKKLRTLSLQRLFISKSFRKKKHQKDEYDKIGRRYSATQVEEWGDICPHTRIDTDAPQFSRSDSPLRSPKRKSVQTKTEMTQPE